MPAGLGAKQFAFHEDVVGIQGRQPQYPTHHVTICLSSAIPTLPARFGLKHDISRDHHSCSKPKVPSHALDSSSNTYAKCWAASSACGWSLAVRSAAV